MLTMLAALSESSVVMEKGLPAWKARIEEVLEMHGPARRPFYERSSSTCIYIHTTS